MLGQKQKFFKIYTIKHFEPEGFKRSTIYNIIKRYEIGMPIEHRSGASRPPFFNRKNLKRLQNATVNRVGVSQRKLARKFAVGRTTLHDNLKNLGLKYYKRLKASKCAEQQLRQIPRKCKKKLRRQLTTAQTFIIVDDEKYFSFSSNDMQTNNGFYVFDKKHTPVNVEYKSKEKYEKKVLVWLAVSAKGISRPFICTTKGPAITADFYIKECLSKLSFIKTYH